MGRTRPPQTRPGRTCWRWRRRHRLLRRSRNPSPDSARAHPPRRSSFGPRDGADALGWRREPPSLPTNPLLRDAAHPLCAVPDLFPRAPRRCVGRLRGPSGRRRSRRGARRWERCRTRDATAGAASYAAATDASTDLATGDGRDHRHDGGHYGGRGDGHSHGCGDGRSVGCGDWGGNGVDGERGWEGGRGMGGTATPFLRGALDVFIPSWTYSSQLQDGVWVSV